jgi:hypothetical protein
MKPADSGKSGIKRGETGTTLNNTPAGDVGSAGRKQVGRDQWTPFTGCDFEHTASVDGTGARKQLAQTHDRVPQANGEMEIYDRAGISDYPWFNVVAPAFRELTNQSLPQFTRDHSSFRAEQQVHLLRRLVRRNTSANRHVGPSVEAI